MKEWIRIKNDGLLNEEFITLLGASTKRDDNSKIGFFGSGMKYSIAYLLRGQIDFHIFIGLKKIEIKTIKKQIGNLLVEKILVNGRETDITTDFGPKWEQWMVIREFYSNAIDEGGEIIELTDEPIPAEGETNIFIRNDEIFNKIFDNFGDYFCINRKPIETLKYKDGNKEITIDVFEKDTQYLRVFRKGILCSSETAHQQSEYDYNLSEVGINESRLIDDNYSLRKMILTTLLEAGYFEFKLDTYEHYAFINEYCNYNTDLTKIYEKVKDKILIPFGYEEDFNIENGVFLPGWLISRLEDKYNDVKTMFKRHIGRLYIYSDKKIPVDVQIEFDDSLLIVKTYLKRMREYNHINFDDVKIRFAKFASKSINGIWNDQTEEILISEDAFENDFNFVAVLLEEFFHMITGFQDHTREFQSYVFERLADQVSKNHHMNQMTLN